MKALLSAAAILLSAVTSHALTLSCVAGVDTMSGPKKVPPIRFTYDVESDKVRNPKIVSLGKLGPIDVGFRFLNSGDDKGYYGFQISEISNPDVMLAGTNVDANNFPKHGQGIVYRIPGTEDFINVWCHEQVN